MAQLDSIWEAVGLLPEQRAAGRSEVERHLGVAVNWPSAYRKHDDRAMLISFLVCCLAFLGCVSLYIANNYSWNRSQLGALIAAFVIATVVQILVLVLASDLKRVFYLLLVGLPVALVGGAVSILSVWAGRSLGRPPESSPLLQITGIGLSGLFVLVMSGSFLLAEPLSRMGYKKLATDFAEALLIESLLDALVTAADEKSWRLAKNRREISESIETAAGWVQLILKIEIRRDPDTAAWLVERRKCIVWNLRQLKRWALAPRLDTHEHFVDRLSKDLLAMSFGSFDEVCHDPMPSASPPQRLRAVLLKAARVVRAFIASLIPLAIALVLIDQDVVGGAAVAPLLAVTVALPAVVLLRLLDPNVLDDMKKAQDLGPKLFGRTPGNS